MIRPTSKNTRAASDRRHARVFRIPLAAKSRRYQACAIDTRRRRQQTLRQ
jgi:hypothetical protein